MIELPTYRIDIQPPEWVQEYIGIPYRLGGRTMEAADCWGICMLILSDRLDLAPPNFTGCEWSAKSRADHRREIGKFIDRASAQLFAPVEAGNEALGDIITLRISGSPLHVGVVVAPGLMLHSAEDADSALERYDGIFWRHRVIGFHRLKAGADERALGEAARPG